MAVYKVVDAEKLESDLTTVADAIREKGGTTKQLEFPQGMADAVRNIEGSCNPYDLFGSIMNQTIEVFDFTDEIVWGNYNDFGDLFNGCIQLKKWAVPNLTWAIPGYMFRQCDASKLTYIDFGKATSFAYTLFYGFRPANASVIIRSVTVPGLNGAFSATGFTNTFFYVPSALVEEYKVATNWTAYADMFRALEDYTVDGTITGELDESKI